ncbi:MAG: glycerophosphodiester phosphodiesterase family protein [Thermodesulfobacteriota bacterium]
MPKIMGHRGAPAYEPENTLRSLELALKLGVAAVEVDVHLSRDGHLVVIHDDTVDRTTNGRGRVRDLTFAELRKLDAGQGERLPSLNEVVDLVRGQAHLFVELKPPEAAGPLLRFFQEHDLFADATIISFWHPVVKALKEQEPRLHTGVLMVGCPVDPVSLAQKAGAQVLLFNYAYVNQDLITQAHHQGLKTYIWNIDHIDTLKHYLPLQPDGIGSNRPDVLVEYLKRI